MPRIAAALLALCFMTPAPARAADGLDLVGQTAFRFGPFTLYEAALFAPEGNFSWDRPFALTLTYRLGLEAEQIADVAVSEMARTTGRPETHFAPLQARLEACFADVQPGDHLSGLSLGPDAASFFHNGTQRCEIEHAGFRDDFFGIWLGDRTRRPDLTAVLTGQNRTP